MNQIWPRGLTKFSTVFFIQIPFVLDLWKKSFNFRYEQTVEDPFHISKACIEPTTGKGNITSVYVECNDEEFIVCNLSDKILNETLDLNFNMGDKIVFKTSVIIQFPNLSLCDIEISRFTKSFLSSFLMDLFWRNYLIVSICITLKNLIFVTFKNSRTGQIFGYSLISVLC